MSWLGRRADIALFLDVDGTLIDIAPTPDAVVVPAGLVGLLGAVRDELDGAVAIVTGRRIDDVDRLFAPARFVIAGLHGAEFRTEPTGAVRSLAAPLPEAVIAGLARLQERVPGLAVEFKGPSATLHWRRAPAAATGLAEKLDEILADVPASLAVTRGRMVLEIGPARVSKGLALERFAALPAFAGRRPIFVGDDVSDVSAFAAAERLGGAGFRVEGETWPAEVADFGSPRQVREWLSLLLERRRP